MNYVALKEIIHNKVLRARAIDRLVDTEIFQELWNVSDVDQKDLAIIYISDLNLEPLKRWVYNHPKRDIDEMGFTELVNLAKAKRIKGYSRMSKTELLRALKHDKATKNRSNELSNPGNEGTIQES